MARILLIESPRANAPSFGPLLEKKGFRVVSAHRVDRALQSAEQQPPDLVILDASSMRTSGTRMCRQIHSRLNGVPVLLLAPAHLPTDPANGATSTLLQPVTQRKLLNRITRLLPGDGKFSLQAGPIQLNVSQRKVRCKGKEARLTPKQTKLLEAFLHSPGQLLTRETLIRQVWHTDYTGDTRTLDVHMSWLRQAIEPDPSRPIYLQTVRGVGYRFDPRDSTSSD